MLRLAALTAMFFLMSGAAEAAYTCTKVGRVKTCVCQSAEDCHRMAQDRPCGDTAHMLCGIHQPRHCSCTFDPLAGITPVKPPVMKAP
jgi:hypothetical protein